jgi:hypothetical protein
VSTFRGAYVGNAEWLPGRPDEFRRDVMKTFDPLNSLKQGYSCREYGAKLEQIGTQDRPAVMPCGVFWGGPSVGSTLGVDYNHDTSRGLTFNNRTRLKVTFNDNSTLADVPIPNAYRTVCLGLPLTDLVFNTDNTRCWTFIMNLRPRVAGCIGTLEDGDCGKKSIFPDGDGSVIPVAAGQTMRAFVYFEDYNRDLTANCSRCDSVAISVLSNPGLPNGATLLETKGKNDLDDSPDAPSRKVDMLVGGATGKAEFYLNSREIHFTPSLHDAVMVDPAHPGVGVKYQVCFEGSSRKDNGAGDVQKSQAFCMYFQVVRPEPVINGIVEARPSPGTNIDMSTPQEVSVRCPYAWDLNLQDAKDTMSALLLRQATDFDAGYEPGKYHIIATEDPAHPLPHGAHITPPGPGVVQQLRWTPVRGMEGHEFEVCVNFKDVVVDEGSVLSCGKFFVRKCEVCSLNDDTLSSIAAEYHTDWLQLWGANYMVENPNHIPEYQRLKLGPMYTTSKDETVRVLASNFGMSIEGLKRVNPDLEGMDSYSMGTPVCLIPRVCTAGDVAM